MQSTNNLIWIDLEMTGLDVENCKIIEIAAIITNKNLDIVAESKPIAIFQPDEILTSMNSWCIQTHNKTGLVQRVKDSKISTETAENYILEFIKRYVPYKTSPLCGNSIWQDRRFLIKYMPIIDEYCNYRMLDVTTLKLINQYWGNSINFNKKNTHKALDDIRESIAELRFYKNNLLI